MDFLGATIFRMVEAIWMNSFLYFLTHVTFVLLAEITYPHLIMILYLCKHFVLLIIKYILEFILVIIKYILQSFCFLLEERE